MHFARRLVVAVVFLAPVLVAAPPAEAEPTLTGITASPNPAAPGELITITGPAVTGGEILCLNGQVLFNSAGREYRFGSRTDMTKAWSVTSRDFMLQGAPAQIEYGTYNIVIDCMSDRAEQDTYPTDLTVTIAPPDPTVYRGISPARLYDTRPGATTIDGDGAGDGLVASGIARSVKVTGRGGVPAGDVKAVVLNVTVTGPSGPGFVTVYPTGEPKPLASNLNYAFGQTVANLVVAKVGTDGQVTLYNEGAAAHLIVDVAGWFPTAASFTPLTPARLLDTRPGQTTVDGTSAGGGSVGQGSVRPLKVTGRGAVPASGVAAVILNVTAVAPTAPSFVTVYPSGELRPLASNLNFTAGRTTPNLVIAKVGPDGQVNLYNDAGSTHLVADVAGWFPTTSSYNALSPARLLDTRSGQQTVDGIGAGEGPVGPRATRVLQVTGRGGVPPTGVGAVVLNLTAVGPTSAGFLTVYPNHEPRPLASNLNFAAGETRANLVITKVGPDGRVVIYNDSGQTHLIADVAGWFRR